ncbi:hypothetical protein ACN9MU_07290 [Pseudoduganella sp. R-32]|uniref:hypothetical protein n=1 Tax=Pseudoduganella sp. R-32 TaxID=3404061 RepID=UPI003CEE2EF4
MITKSEAKHAARDQRSEDASRKFAEARKATSTNAKAYEAYAYNADQVRRQCASRNKEKESKHTRDKWQVRFGAANHKA